MTVWVDPRRFGYPIWVATQTVIQDKADKKQKKAKTAKKDLLFNIGG